MCRALGLAAGPDGGIGHHLRHLDEADSAPTFKLGAALPGPGKAQARWVNESGLYSLIMRSRKPEAKAFQKWVTSEVLPAIPGPLGHGKNGGYMTPEVAKLATEDPAVFVARALGSSTP